jgi:hypothetical protein
MADLTAEQLEFIQSGPAVAMITVGEDGYAKPVRIGLAVLDGELVATATEGRRRTPRLRADPRCTLYFSDAQFKYLSVETTVTIVDGNEEIDGTVRLVRHWQSAPEGPVTWYGETLEPDVFRQRMVDEGRVLYRFAVVKAYGLLVAP